MNVTALSSALSLYGIAPLVDSPPANAAGDAAADVGPAAALMLSSMNLQGQMVSTLMSSASSLGQHVNALA